MGPQLYRCGNTKRHTLPDLRLPSFNGAATLSLRKFADLARAAGPYRWLQWDRNFIVAETTFFNLKGEGVLRLASMGPQLYRCGNVAWFFGFDFLFDASMGPQLYRCGNASGHLEDSLKLYCFNGAATLSLWK